MDNVTEGFLDGLPVTSFMATKATRPTRGRVSFAPEVASDAKRAYEEGQLLRDTLTGEDRHLHLTAQALGEGDPSYEWVEVRPTR